MLKKRWFRILILERIFISALIALQFILLINAIFNQSITSALLNAFFKILSLAASIYIISQNTRGGVKLSWVFVILLFPVFGGILYLVCLIPYKRKKGWDRLRAVKKKSNEILTNDKDAKEEAISDYPEHKTKITYLQNAVGFPVYNCVDAKFFSPGEKKLEALLPELMSAEKYIFLEYFIIKEGKMWDSILEILKKKAGDGVLVRILYDDFGCFMTLPNDYPKKLAEYGIECRKFNRFAPKLSARQNHRDHRKIISIDGKVAFTGGINLSDEYINEYERHGHWKDAAAMIKGDGARSFTLMFLEMWQVATDRDEDFLKYLPSDSTYSSQFDGYVAPFADIPRDNENVSEQVYLSIINNAKNYVYINTPYLILDDVMLSALSMAAKSGVDVRITTPHIGDKWFVHTTTRSYYEDLISSGVKIYEYTPGFLHAKTFVSDGTVGTVGSINLDYRSLYTNFECGALFIGGKILNDMKEDYLSTLEKCEKIVASYYKTNRFIRYISRVLRIFAPLM